MLAMVGVIMLALLFQETIAQLTAMSTFHVIIGNYCNYKHYTKACTNYFGITMQPMKTAKTYFCA